MSDLKLEYEKFVAPTYARFDLDLVSGTGARVVDAGGRGYLDFGGGIAVCSLGHAHPAVTEAVARQAATLVHTSNLYRTFPQGALAQRLVEITGPGKVFSCNSGAEANEGLIKLARKAGGARFGVLTFAGSFHGRTMAGISATGQEKVKVGFAPLVEGFRHAEFNSLEAAEAALGPETGAILVEPVQGEGGVNVATPEFLRGLRELCDRRGLLLFFDEVQCGLGRLGEMCAWRAIAPDVEPDAVSWAKGIANGFPLGAFWVSSRAREGTGPLCDVLGPGSHGTTYGGNPVCCSAALAVLDTIEKEGLLENVRAMGARLCSGLRSRGLEVRGIGLMLGVVLPEGISSRDASVALQGRGLLVVPAGERVVRLLPPLNVSAAEVDEALEILSAEFSGKA